jgi:hypothetical protein
MPSMTREEKIAQLLRKAEQCGPAEAEALTEMATKLMKKYVIEKAVIDAIRLGQDRTAETIVTKDVDIDGIYLKALFQGFSEVVFALGELRMVGVPFSGGKKMHVRIIGFESDVDQAITLINSLNIQAVVAMRTFWNALDYKPAGAEGYNMRRSYIAGFFSGASRRISANKLTVIEEVDREQGASSALVLLDRAQAVDTYMDQTYGGRLKAARGMKTNGSSYSDGVRDGRNANTGDKGVAASHNAIGG